jgi:NOL1/NOP2/fmu family ribosome biogenesis protein
VLKDNVAVWGDPNVFVSSSLPSSFASLDSFFDIILVDAPCSGEGMFRKEPQALSQWSPKLVDECAERQLSILNDVYPALADGGFILYSTCTYNRQENEEVVEAFSAQHSLQKIDLRSLMGQIDTQGQMASQEQEALQDRLFYKEGMVRLIPGWVRGEGQFCALLQKSFPEDYEESNGKQEEHSRSLRIWTQDDSMFAVPAHLIAYLNTIKKAVRLIHGGVKIAEKKGKDWLPFVDLALNLILSEQKEFQYETAQLDRQTALQYLHGDSFSLPSAPKGILLLTYQGIPMGFAKNLGTRCNNLYPKSRRIKMDVR